MTFNYVSHSMMEYIVGKLKDFATAAAAAVLGTSNDTASDNTVYGAKAYADDAAGTAEQNAKGYADGLASNYDAAGTAAGLIEALDATESQTAGSDGLALQVTQVDGVITGISGSIAADTYDAHGAAAAVLGTAQDDQTANTVYGAKAYADAVAAAAVTAAYKPGGSKAASAIKDTTNDLLVAANEGKVYNLTDDLVIADGDKSRFVENVAGSYPAGTNVAVINVGTTQSPSFKFDIMPGLYNFVDVTTSTVDGWFSSGE